MEKANQMRPLAKKCGLSMIQFASIWNLSHPAVESLVPAFIQESGEGGLDLLLEAGDPFAVGGCKHQIFNP